MKRHGAGGLHVTGVVSATVGQNCVVTLEPLTNEVEEAVDLVFVPKEPPAQEEAETEPRDVKWGDPEPLIGGIVDLGALATEFLILGLDPYPRKPDAVFEPPQKPHAGRGPVCRSWPSWRRIRLGASNPGARTAILIPVSHSHLSDLGH